MRNEKSSLIEELLPDRELSAPAYQQIYDRLFAMIESGKIATGQSLPSERTLAEKLNLSRTTVRRAYNELRENNLLATHGRNGVTAIAPPKVQPKLGKLKGFTEEAHDLGLVPSTRLIENVIISDRMIASIFGRPSSAQFLKLIRVRCGDGCPMSREVAWYDLTVAPELSKFDPNCSVYDFLARRCGIALARGEQTIEAVMSSEEEMRVFGFSEPSPCLLIKRNTYGISGQLIEYVEGTFRGDAYAYKVSLDMS